MKQLNRKLNCFTSYKYLPNQFLSKNIFSFNKFKFSVAGQDISVKSDNQNIHYPIRGFPKFANGKYTVFEFNGYDKVQQVPWEIKECSWKGFLYTFFIMWGGRLFTSYATYTTSGLFFPVWGAGCFLFQYAKIAHYMVNAISAIRLKENGTHVILEFKNYRPSVEVEISRIIKKDNLERTILESFAEPYLLPIEINYEDVYGKASLRSKKKYYIYGDSHNCIKDGEIFRAIINSQPIKLN